MDRPLRPSPLELNGHRNFFLILIILKKNYFRIPTVVSYASSAKIISLVALCCSVLFRDDLNVYFGTNCSGDTFQETSILIHCYPALQQLLLGTQLQLPREGDG